MYDRKDVRLDPYGLTATFRSYIRTAHCSIGQFSPLGNCGYNYGFKKMAVRIVCINKDNGNHYNPHEAIQNFGWLTEGTLESGNSTLAQIVDYLEKGNHAYVLDKFGDKAYLVVQQRN